MNGRRAIVGLCMLCALMVSAFAAQSASATTDWGWTAVTCKKGAGDTGGQTFETAHCKEGEGSGEYGHYEIKKPTTLTGNNNGENTELKTTVGGFGVTLTSTSLTGSGSMENKLEGKEHTVHGTGVIVYSNVSISVPKCVVYTDDGTATPGAQGVVDTEELTATSKGQEAPPAEMFLKFEPVNAEKIFAKFWILDKNKKGAGGECNIPGTYVVTGSVKGKPDGATTSFTEAGTTAQNTLKMGIGGGAGVKAGVGGTLTIEGKDPAVEGDTFKPLSSTTYNTETP